MQSTDCAIRSGCTLFRFFDGKNAALHPRKIQKVGDELLHLCGGRLECACVFVQFASIRYLKQLKEACNGCYGRQRVLEIV
jgi:hypothetical protein